MTQSPNLLFLQPKIPLPSGDTLKFGFHCTEMMENFLARRLKIHTLLIDSTDHCRFLQRGPFSDTTKPDLLIVVFVVTTSCRNHSSQIFRTTNFFYTLYSSFLPFDPIKCIKDGLVSEQIHFSDLLVVQNPT